MTRLPAIETPPHIARQMIDKARATHTRSLLEPSAGTGNIAIEAHRMGLDVWMIELNVERNIALQRLEIGSVLHADFLKFEPTYIWRSQIRRFDAVVMNPPMNALPHVLHGVRFLKPGGRLVALLHTHVAEEARDILGAEIDYLPQETFEFDGRVIPSAILTVRT